MEENRTVTNEEVEHAAKQFEESKNKLFQTMNELQEKGKLHMLREEEMQLLQTFKNFKAGLKKPTVFKWMTQPYAPGEE